MWGLHFFRCLTTIWIAAHPHDTSTCWTTFTSMFALLFGWCETAWCSLSSVGQVHLALLTYTVAHMFRLSSSTMMAEHYALSHVMKEVLPLKDLTRAVASEVGIKKEALINFKTTVWEDNMGALTLANLEPGQQTPRSKFYDVRVHWFRQHLHQKENRMCVQRVDTSEQLADIFTKWLPKDTFTKLRKKLLGW